MCTLPILIQAMLTKENNVISASLLKFYISIPSPLTWKVSFAMSARPFKKNDQEMPVYALASGQKTKGSALTGVWAINDR